MVVPAALRGRPKEKPDGQDYRDQSGDTAAIDYPVGYPDGVDAAGLRSVAGSRPIVGSAQGNRSSGIRRDDCDASRRRLEGVGLRGDRGSSGELAAGAECAGHPIGGGCTHRRRKGKVGVCDVAGVGRACPRPALSGHTSLQRITILNSAEARAYRRSNRSPLYKGQPHDDHDRNY
jgi:hypothetical protein